MSELLQPSRRALQGSPDPLGPLLRAAVADHRAGRRVEAERVYRRIVATEPNGVRKAHGLHLLGILARDCGHVGPAVDLLAQSVAMLPADDPAAGEFRGNWGAALHEAGRDAEAAAVLEEAIRLQPARAESRHNLSVALERVGRMADAEAAARRAVELKPGYGAAHNQLGTVLRHQGRIDEAEAAHRGALALDANDIAALSGLGHVHGEQGRAADSIACYRRIIELHPTAASSHSDLLYTLHYDDRQTPASLFAEHLEWARRHAPTPATDSNTVPAFAVDRNPDRRLRVGYISHDLKGHPVARFLEPALVHHDRAQVEVFCYSDVARPDRITARLRRLADGWCDTAGLPDAAVADQIRRDQIDVLVDQDGHASGGPRMRLLGLRPAPVQVAYNGYIDTTGLDAMDWRITDAHQDPPGMTEQYHTERLYRLPDCNWCYAPDEDSPDVAPAPAIRNGYITFGSLNKFVKASPSALRLWARVLQAVPTSRLRVAIAGTPDTNHYPLQRLAECGIPADRVDFAPKTRTRPEYLERFAEIDLCLDALPFNGITTTCDALWMGVPVVTLAGATFASRAGVSLLSAVGLPELVAPTADAYVGIAASVASEFGRLSDLRAGMRTRVGTSPLQDGAGFARRLETAYRHMWHHWCSAQDV